MLTCRQLIEDCAVGILDQILDDFGYCVTVMARKPSELRFGLDVDEELNALLGAVDTEMTLAIAPLLLGRKSMP